MNRLTANLPDFQVKNFISGDFQLYLTGLFTGKFDTFTHHWIALGTLYQKSFGCKPIRPCNRPQIPVESAEKVGA